MTLRTLHTTSQSQFCCVEIMNKNSFFSEAWFHLDIQIENTISVCRRTKRQKQEKQQKANG
jgi:hypothetical protein